MTTIPKQWTFSTLPDEAINHFKKQHILSYVKAYRENRDHYFALTGAESGLFGMLGEADDSEKPDPKIKVSHVIWGTDNYDELGTKYRPNKPIHDLSVIRPRVEKTKEEQKRRVKAKAEVFTPSWVCNLQNNLFDDEIIYPNAFNTSDMVNKTWTPNPEKVKFDNESNKSWLHYVAERRLEMTCGEGPYLFSRYDTTTGDYLPVKDENGLWQRIGFLDRKLRVVAENVDNAEDWKKAAEIAMRCTYGYEWQGDNLMLARLNMVNTYFDYYREFCNFNNFPWPPNENLEELAVEMAEIISWQLWQMDGLKMVTPDSCSDKCVACVKGKRSFHGHDGDLPVLRWGAKLKVFEDMLLS